MKISLNIRSYSAWNIFYLWFMLEVNKQGLTLLQFENLSGEEEIVHYITTRKGGISAGHMEGLNLSYSVEDDPGNVDANRKLLAEAMGVESGRLVFPKQTHSDRYKIVTASNLHEPMPDTDAVITAEREIALAVMSADCVPVLLYDKEKKVIAAIHAGWKGTVNGIVRNVVRAMKDEFGSRPQHILAGIGPSISPEKYEVGPEVVEEFRRNFSNSAALLSRFQGEKAHVDLWKSNKTWLLEEGLPEENIEIAGICTFGHPDRFYSARYFKNKTGRFAGCIKNR